MVTRIAQTTIGATGNKAASTTIAIQKSLIEIDYRAALLFSRAIHEPAGVHLGCARHRSLLSCRSSPGRSAKLSAIGIASAILADVARSTSTAVAVAAFATAQRCLVRR